MADNSNIYLPPNWSWVKLGEAGQIITGTTPSKNNLKNYGDYVPLYKPSDLNVGTNILSAKDNLSKIGIENARLLPEGSILVTCIGATIGKTGLIKKAGASNQQINAIVPGPNFISEFIYYFCISENFRKQIHKNASSTTLPILNKSKFEKLIIPLPPLPEQKKIVEKIEELFSGLDSGVASLKKAKEQIRLYRQSVLSAAFSGRLVKDEKRETKNELEAYLNGVKGVTNKKTERLNAIQEVIEQGNSEQLPYKQVVPKAAEPKVEYSNQLPDGWKWVKLGEILEVKDGTHDTPKYHDKGIPFITQKNIKNGEFVFDNYNLISEEDHQKFYKRSNVVFNDIIISMIGANRGMSTIVKTKETFSIKNVGLVKTDESKFLAKYLAYFFKSEIGQSSILSQSKGGAQQFIGLTELRNWSVPFQPLNHQTQIVEEIEKRFSEADNLEKAIDDSLTKSEALRQSILKQAFEGRLIK